MPMDTPLLLLKGTSSPSLMDHQGSPLLVEIGIFLSCTCGWNKDFWHKSKPLLSNPWSVVWRQLSCPHLQTSDVIQSRLIPQIALNEGGQLSFHTRSCTLTGDRISFRQFTSYLTSGSQTSIAIYMGVLLSSHAMSCEGKHEGVPKNTFSKMNKV